MVSGISAGLTVPAVSVGWFDVRGNSIMVVNFNINKCGEFGVYMEFI